MIQEVEYTAVNNKAELGQLLNVSVITKSGTNSIHGDVFDNFASNVLEARNYFCKQCRRLVQTTLVLILWPDY
jgi:hypothetical protein